MTNWLDEYLDALESRDAYEKANEVATNACKALMSVFRIRNCGAIHTFMLYDRSLANLINIAIYEV